MSGPFEDCPFEDCAGEGLSRIAPNHRCLFEADTEKLSALYSVDIDSACRERHQNARRWDYGIWYSLRATQSGDRVDFVEVHKAEAGEVSAVIAKKRWLEEQLTGIRIPQRRWFWVPTGRMLIPKNSAQYRQFLRSGIRMVPRINIPG